MRAPAVPGPLALGAVMGVLLAACGPGATQPSSTPTPLPSSLLQQRYLAAAGAYNTAEHPIAAAENTYCVAAAASADLTRCEAALSGDRQATLAFDNAVRTLEFPASARADVNQLLADDQQLETVLQQASTAPSLTAIASLTPRIFQFLTTASQDADRLRGDIGLPLLSPSPSASASPAT